MFGYGGAAGVYGGGAAGADRSAAGAGWLRRSFLVHVARPNELVVPAVYGIRMHGGVHAPPPLPQCSNT